MIHQSGWISEILSTLLTYRVESEPVSEFCWKLNDQLISFVPSNNTDRINKKGDIIIHEDFFHTRKEQLINRLKSQLRLNTNRIHGRSTKVFEITKNQAKKFVDANHLMGFSGGKTFFGLFYKDELVAVAAFAKIRFMKYEDPPYYSSELERFCSLKDSTVVGGLDKVIHHYSKIYKPDDLITFIDLDWSQGKSFLKLGFEKVTITPPILFAVNSKTFERRVILSDSDKMKGEYLIQNRGNLKLRKVLKNGFRELILR